MHSGQEDAAGLLASLVYAELHVIAENAMRREGAGHTLQPTILVHEAFMRLIDQSEVNWQGRGHFYALAAQAIRRILVDHARRRRAAKRGGGLPATFPDHGGESEWDALDIMALDDALGRLAAFDERQARVIELRFFGGLDIAQTAEALGISTATVKRDWAFARAFLQRELEAGEA